jgi:hypothetical protein
MDLVSFGVIGGEFRPVPAGPARLEAMRSIVACGVNMLNFLPTDHGRTK